MTQPGSEEGNAQLKKAEEVPMVDAAVVDAVRNYLSEVRRAGIWVSRGILFGSHAKGQGLPDSDIDVLVIAPDFDPRLTGS